MSIKNELSELKGVKKVDGDPQSKSITVQCEAPATLEKILDALKQNNYPAQ
jgi:copper chaperone CopZ